MYLIEGILLNCIYLLFPISVYLIISTHAKVKDRKVNDLLFEITLFSSLYLLFKFGKNITNLYPMIIFNIPLLIAYLKKKNKTAVLISILLIFYYHNISNINYVSLIIEYTVYFITYNVIIKRKKDTPVVVIANFVFIKSFSLAFRAFYIYKPNNSLIVNLGELIFTLSIFILISYLCLYLLNKAEKLLDLNKVVTQLEKEKTLKNSIFKVTHEIKNPIAVCKGYIDMMDYSDYEKTKRYIEIVKDQIDRTLILMDDFLEHSKIKLNKDEVDLYMLLEDSCSVCESLLRKSHIKLNFDIPDEELYMDIDYNRMKQVIVNIFKNAIEAKDKKKKEHYINMKVYEKNNEVIIKVKDNGIGIDKKILKKIGEMFFTTKEKGTGLGVSLSKEIIELHNGSIKYTSIKGKYTIVTITLPYKKEK